VHELFVDFKKAYDSVKREVLYNILLEFAISKKLVRLMKTSLKETYSKVRVGKFLCDKFPIQIGLKQEMLFRHCFSILLQNMLSGKSKKMKWAWNSMGHISYWSMLTMLIYWAIV
jgi:hypothetical protein